MINRKIKQIGAWILTACLILGYAQLPVKAEEETRTNMALIATATASSSEAPTVLPENANDGDRTSHSSRWGSGISEGPEWLQLSWVKPKNLVSFTIYWEVRKAKGYRIEVSDTGEEGSWETVYSNEGIPQTKIEEINLPNMVTTQYVRLYVDKIDPADPDGGDWYKTVSLYEFEAWSLDPLPDDRTELEKIIDEIEAPTILEGALGITMPDLPDGATARFCADYEQIIREDGSICQPLETRVVKGFYEVTLDQESAKTQEFTVTVPGKYTDGEGANAKPPVIPELQEWHGTSGTFLASGASRIIVGNAGLSAVAEEFAKDYKDITGFSAQVINGTKEDAKRGDFYLDLTAKDMGLDKEGYVMEIADAVFVDAEQPVGAYYATRSILQILKQADGSIPKGLVRDYPKYEVRGFSLDVGRKPFALDTLQEFAKNMSWYKMNSFQVHLSDNLIFMEDYSTIEEAKEQTYAGFRLESGVLNSEGKSATSEDVYYTKDDFRNFIQDSRSIGVDIVPELDMPAHALPFTRAFPEFRTKRETGGSHKYLIDELDLSNPQATEFAKSLWEDYFTGSEPVFDEDTVIHIGTDEYHGAEGQAGNEQFRQFSADMIEFVQDSGRTVRMWGSLSNKTGTTPVPSKDVQLNIWNTGYSDPKDMYKLGYDMINTLDVFLYMVPNGTGNRGGYGDYLNTQYLYNTWQPNNFNGYTVPAGSDQMLGACFAVWHDNIDTRANGISQYDSFERFFDALPVMGAKLWGEAEDRNYDGVKGLASKTGTAPDTNVYGDVDFTSQTIAKWEFEESLEKDSSVNGYDLNGRENVRMVNSDDGTALRLMGGKSYMTTPFDMVGEDALLTMKVKRDIGAEGEQILCESKDVFGTCGTYAFKAVQKNTGKVGFSREGYDYSFNYILPENEWVTLTFQSGQQEVALYVDGKLVDKNPEIYYSNHPKTELSATIAQRGTKKVATMMVPIGRIGSMTNSFKGQIEFVSVATEFSIEGEPVPQAELTAEACSAAPTSGNEGPAEFALDGNNNTFWHSNWGSDISLENGHHWFKVTLQNPTVISALSYLPRQDNINGRIYEYSIEVEKADGSTVTVVDHGTWPANNNRKTAEFEPVEAKKVKIQVHDSQGDGPGGVKKHATIAELNLYKPLSFDKAQLESKITEAAELNQNEYTDMSWNAVANALKAAQKIAAKEGSTTEENITAYNQLDAAIKGLVTKAVNDRLSDAVKAAEQADAKDYTQDSFAAYQGAAQEAANLSDDATEEQKLIAAETVEAAKGSLVYIGGLRDALQAVTEDVLAGCTQNSQTAYNTAKAEAEAVIADGSATKAQVDAALAKINETADSLVDLTGLQTAIQDVLERKKEDYTPGSWKTLQDAKANAEALLAKADATKTEVSQAILALYGADEALVSSEPISGAGMLLAVIDAYNQMDLDGYTPESREAMEDALKAAKNVSGNPNASTEQIETAITGVLAAAAALKADTTDLEEELLDAQGRIDTLNDLIETLQGELDGVDGKITQAVEAAKQALQEELDQVKEKLQNAAKDMLNTVIGAYSKLDLTGYTSASKKALEDALKNAKAVSDKQDAQAEEIQAATASVLAAAAGLRVDIDVDTSGLEDALNTANRQIETLNNLTQELQGNLNASNTEISNLKKALQDAQNAAQEELNKVKAALEKEAADAKKKAEEAELAAKKAQQELEEAKKREAVQKAELERLAAQAEELRKAAEEAKKFAQEAQLKAEQAMEKTKFAAGNVAVKSAKSTKKGKAKVTWNKVKGADGYKVIYSQTWDFRKSKSVKVSAKSASKTISKLKSGKKYYFRVRAYQKIDGKEIYSRPSVRKQVRIK